jgi:hypothetical protein
MVKALSAFMDDDCQQNNSIIEKDNTSFIGDKY